MDTMWNTVKTTLFLGALTGLFLVIGGALGGTTGMAIALLLAIGMNMGAWWFSDKIALRMSGAREVTAAEQPDLHQLVAQLAQRAELPMPRVYIVETPMPNAFATGRTPNRSAVAVTTGIMELLPRAELSGVIAHELAHIKHRDTLIASVAASVAGAVTFMAEMAQWALIFGGLGGGDEEEGGGVSDLVGSLAMLILAPIAALLIQMAISRSREYSADAGGARILGDPLPLANALERLEGAVQRAPAAVNPAASHLYIVNPLMGGMGNLFRTHPVTAKRVEKLRAMVTPAGALSVGY